MIYKKKYVYLIMVAILLFLIWFYGFLQFSKFVFAQNQQVLPTTKREGIIVLTGGRNRIAQGAELLNKGLGERLLITGVSENVTLKMIEEGEGVDFNKKELVDIGYVARSTVGNAREVDEWLKKYQYKKLYVVTSFYHILRSRLELENLLPENDFEFIAVFSDYVEKEWWKHWGSFMFLAREYTKFLIVFVQYKILGL